jgi:hypothetical protein
MDGVGVVSYQIPPPLLGYRGCFVIRPGNSANGIKRIPDHDGRELNLVFNDSSEEFAQNGHIEAARIPGFVSRHERAFLRY